ncbi:MAG TPA: hypothetical protein VGN04_06765 [Herbaspirillum sp.]
MKLLTHAAACLALVLSNHVLAADQVHLRGEITAINGNQLVVTTTDGANATVTLPDNVQVLDVSRTNAAAIAENSYLGIAAGPAPGGKLRARGVMVFPEGARGLNEGHFPWDKGSNGTMTNATVAKLVKKNGLTELEMRFNGKTQKVVLDSATVFGQFVPGKRELIAVKSKVLVFAEPSADGKGVAQLIMVGRDGFLPPI